VIDRLSTRGLTETSADPQDGRRLLVSLHDEIRLICSGNDGALPLPLWEAEASEARS
jgi:hypothetical protein